MSIRRVGTATTDRDSSPPSNTIGNLRVLDLPLAQIREFVTTRDMDLMQRQLTKQQELIERKRRELERMSRKIDQRLALLSWRFEC